ncbi:phosphatase PAP2 family protein [Georgenia alba]|uniref:Phosphatase PAP2 family protein n=1 Tax=Georgenia alba TaxID=2233858 RepID=A0ABW2QA81_9MICO
MRHLQRLASLPVLATAFVVLTLLAGGPLRPYESVWHRFWIREYPEWAKWLLQDVLDRLTGDTVSIPVLLITAIVVARRLRSWRPMYFAAATVVSFAGIGILKVVLARPTPMRQDPTFFAGGWFTDGWQGIAYPSGHASEAILFYGAAAYLILHYERPGRRVRRIAVGSVVCVAIISVTTSYILGWHWLTDMPAGLLAGGVMLHIAIWADRTIVPRVLARLPWLPGRPAPQRRPQADRPTVDPPPAGRPSTGLAADQPPEPPPCDQPPADPPATGSVSPPSTSSSSA